MTHQLEIPTEILEAGGVTVPLPTLPIATLDVPVEWMRFCQQCESEQRFVADRVCVHGLIGACTRCGDERIANFTRTTWEPA